LALLHLLKDIFPADHLAVAHLNHKLRPPADAEERCVRDTAEGWGIVCYHESADVAGAARQHGMSVEEAGRKARYDFLARTAIQIGSSTVAVAHHADDQAETILMHLLRGAGLAGLRGMSPSSALPGASELTLVRPFLHVTRAQIEAYCRSHKLNPVEDHTNQDTTYLRNRLRHDLLPILEDYNPQIRRHLQQMASIASADYATIEDLAQQRWDQLLLDEGDGRLSLDCTDWLRMPLSIRRAIVRKALRHLRPALHDITFVAIEQVRQMADRGGTGSKITLPGGIMVTVEYGQLIMATDPGEAPIHLPQLSDDSSLTLPVPGIVQLGNGWTIEARLEEKTVLSQAINNRDPWQAFVDLKDKVLQIRPRRSGERFQPLGMDGSSAKVKDLMINRKIAARLRSSWPLVANETHLVWLVGHHIDERVCARPSSHQIVRLCCRPPADSGNSLQNG
jgi:tRNA(Ile)-lysidine synthase